MLQKGILVNREDGKIRRKEMNCKSDDPHPSLGLLPIFLYFLSPCEKFLLGVYIEREMLNVPVRVKNSGEHTKAARGLISVLRSSRPFCICRHR